MFRMWYDFKINIEPANIQMPGVQVWWLSVAYGCCSANAKRWRNCFFFTMLARFSRLSVTGCYPFRAKLSLMRLVRMSDAMGMSNCQMVDVIASCPDLRLMCLFISDKLTCFKTTFICVSIDSMTLVTTCFPLRVVISQPCSVPWARVSFLRLSLRATPSTEY